MTGVEGRRRAAAVIALWGLAVAQPVLDLFGRNPEYFVVNGITGVELVLFGLLVVVSGPLVLLGLEWVADRIDRRLGLGVHVVVLGVLALAFWAALLNQFDLDDTAVVVGVALWLAVAVVLLERRAAWFRTGLTYLAFAPILFFVAFVGFSESSTVLRQGAEDVEPGVVTRPAPVVVLSLDELPLASLLRPDGTINAERFPNVARLAAASTWYRDATSVAATTTSSVPATLTGRLPEGQQSPDYRDHPRSLFTLLGDAYDQHAVEQVTDLCPPELCPEEEGDSQVELRRSLSDVAAVYGHLVLPVAWRDRLPVVDRSWGGFLATADTGEPAGVASIPGAAEPGVTVVAQDDGVAGADPDCPKIELWCAPALLEEFIADIEGGGTRPVLHMAHVTTPHLPWIVSTTGRQYAPRRLTMDGVDTVGAWVPDVVPVRQGFQRHLLQAGNLDRLLGRLIDRLEAEGLWEDALVVVVADHGISFTPGTMLRVPEFDTLHEIYNVPLFVKAPGQTEGSVSDVNALTVDVLPTIVDLLGIETDWEFDGTSLRAPGPRRIDKPIFYEDIEGTVPVGFAGVLEVAARNAQYLPYGEDWLAVAAVGSYGDLVGGPVDGLDRSGDLVATAAVAQSATLADWDPDAPVLAPLLLDGRLTIPSGAPPPPEVLVAVDGRVAGVGVGMLPDGDGYRFRALIAEELLRAGANRVQLLVPSGAGERTFTVLPLVG